MRNARDVKLDKLFAEYLKVTQEIFDKCDDDEMFSALTAKIAHWAVGEILGWFWEENHIKDREDA